MTLAVTLLYVPADREDRVAKALSLDTDVVIVDLEDAVAPAGKEQARAAVPALLRDRGTQPAGRTPRVQVRVNALDTPWGADDLDMVAGLDADVAVRVPKVQAPDTVDAVVGRVGSARALHCLLESATGVERALDIARHGASVASIGLGEADLRSELGVVGDHGLDWVRGRVVVAAAAAGLPPPVQSVYTAVRDLDGLAASCRDGRALGFVGRCAIHPAQLPVIRAAFRPAAEEVARATELLATLRPDASGAGGAGMGGAGVAVLSDGSFVDAAMVAGARRVLELEALTRR